MENKAKEWFNAGILLGRLHGVMMVASNDSRVQNLVEEIQKALLGLGLNLGVHDLASYEELARKKVRESYGESESACLELGLDLIPLQTNLKMLSLASPSRLTNAIVVQISSALTALLEQMRFEFARVGALEIATPFLLKIGKVVADPNIIIQSSAAMFKETEVLQARFEAWLDNELSATGDVFEHITNAFIVNRPTNTTIKVEKSFNMIDEKYGNEIATALSFVEKEISESGNKEAAELFEGFKEELQKPEPRRSVLKNIWNGIERALPTIAALVDITAKISKLLSGQL
jgi:hypothetical protein